MISKIVKKILFTIISLSLLGCGFEVLHESKLKNYSIKQINTEGNKRIGQKIKNDLLALSVDTSADELLIDIETKKLKTVKEKNIKNEITKYQIDLNIKVTYNFIGSEKKDKISNYSVTGDYTVSNIHSESIIKEKRLINNLIDKLSKMIISEITLNFNDL